jgi:hypothetical protein
MKDFLNITKDMRFKIYDVTGKIVVRGKGRQIDVRKLKSGLYILELKDDNGLKTIKLVK